MRWLTTLAIDTNIVYRNFLAFGTDSSLKRGKRWGGDGGQNTIDARGIRFAPLFPANNWCFMLLMMVFGQPTSILSAQFNHHITDRTELEVSHLGILVRIMEIILKSNTISCISLVWTSIPSSLRFNAYAQSSLGPKRMVISGQSSNTHSCIHSVHLCTKVNGKKR